MSEPAVPPSPAEAGEPGEPAVAAVGGIPEHTVELPIALVTVLEDRAMVTRRGPLPRLAGQLRLRLPEVSPLLVDKSLRATVSPASSARVLDLRCVRSLAPWKVSSDEAARANPANAAAATLQAAATAARLELEQARTVASIAREDLAAHVKLRRAELLALAAAATRGQVSAEAATAVAAELAAHDEMARATVVRIAEADEQVAERERAVRDADALVELAGRRAGVESARLELDCLGDPAGGELTVEYLVPAAAWRPFHRAQLGDGSAATAAAATTTEPITWEQGACIWQRTGEDWTDVELALSAERASLGVEPPALEDDLLDVHPKPSQVAVAAREQEIEHVGIGAAAAAGEAVVMGIDDGGLGLLLKPRSRATIQSDGRPHRVALETFRSEAELALIVIPLRSPLCHLRTRFDNRATTPILSGPVDLIRRSGFIGTADIDFISAGERAELGFGTESEVRVHREEHEEQEESSLLGGWTSKVVRVAIRLSNLGTTARQITVCDRVPVSEIEQVVITVAGPEAYLLAKEARPGEPKIPQTTARTIDPNGLVTWQVPLPPKGRAAVTLEYKVKSQRGVTGL